MNWGLATGTVLYSNGRPASNIYVKLTSVLIGSVKLKVTGSTQTEGGFSWKSAEAYTDSGGKFNIPFSWSDADYSGDMSTATMNLVAFNNPSGVTTASGKLQVKVLFFKSIQDLSKFCESSLGKSNIQPYAIGIRSFIKKHMSDRLLSRTSFETKNLLMLGKGSIILNSSSQNEYNEELLPEFNQYETAQNYQGKMSPSSQKCTCSNSNPAIRPNQGDPATGWESDNESFTVHTANYHLSDFYKVNDRVAKVYNCCIDPDFFIRRCDFITMGNAKGNVLWLPLTKKVGISVCFNGQKNVCWYDYSIDLQGRLILKNRNCLKNASQCNN